VGRLGRLLSRSAAPEDERARLLRERHIDLVLDVGANEGLYAARLRADGYRGRIVSFEPLSAAFAKLERASAGDTLWQALHTALGSRRGNALLNVAGNWASSSLLPMDARLPKIEPRTAYVATEEVGVETLDDLRPSLVRPDDRVLLKVDVQGYELEVLRGAQRTLGQVEAAQVELSLVPLYDGAPSPDEVTRFLEARGLSRRAEEPAWRHPQTGEVLQVDALFVRP
jgi:FkbM family methyltransferase